MKKYSFLVIALAVLLQVNNYVLAETQGTASHKEKSKVAVEAHKVAAETAHAASKAAHEEAAQKAHEAATAHEAAAEAHKTGK